MRKMNLIVLTLVAMFLLAAPLASGQGGNPPASTKESGATSGHGMTAVEQGENRTVEQQITALADQFTQALGKADIGFMEKNFAEEFVGVHSDGKLSTKAQEIENVKSGALKWESVDIQERKVRVYGGTALVVALASSKGAVGGKPYSGDYRTIQVWAKQKGNWKLVAFQSTRASAQ